MHGIGLWFRIENAEIPGRPHNRKVPMTAVIVQRDSMEGDDLPMTLQAVYLGNEVRFGFGQVDTNWKLEQH